MVCIWLNAIFRYMHHICTIGIVYTKLASCATLTEGCAIKFTTSCPAFSTCTVANVLIIL